MDVVRRRRLTDPSGQFTVNSTKNLQALNYLCTLANTDKVTEPNPGSTTAPTAAGPSSPRTRWP